MPHPLHHLSQRYPSSDQSGGAGVPKHVGNEGSVIGSFEVCPKEFPMAPQRVLGDYLQGALKFRQPAKALPCLAGLPDEGISRVRPLLVVLLSKRTHWGDTLVRWRAYASPFRAPVYNRNCRISLVA